MLTATRLLSFVTGIIELINYISKDIEMNPKIKEKLNVVFIENYCVTLAEYLMPASEISEQISLAGFEASGTGNMKFMINGAVTFGTMDGANVEICDAVGDDNIFIFGMSADEVINHEKYRDYNPMDIFNSDQEIRQVLMQLINGFYSQNDTELFRPLYDSLLNTNQTQYADTYFCLKDFRAYAKAQEDVEAAYRDEVRWARMAMLNMAHVGKFSSDRTIQDYVDDIWHLDKITVELE